MSVFSNSRPHFAMELGEKVAFKHFWPNSTPVAPTLSTHRAILRLHAIYPTLEPALYSTLYEMWIGFVLILFCGEEQSLSEVPVFVGCFIIKFPRPYVPSMITTKVKQIIRLPMPCIWQYSTVHFKSYVIHY